LVGGVTLELPIPHRDRNLNPEKQ